MGNNFLSHCYILLKLNRLTVNFFDWILKTIILLIPLKLMGNMFFHKENQDILISKAQHQQVVALT